MSLSEQIAALPLPLAQLWYRSLAAKSPFEAHNLVFFLAEAALRLCSVVRVGTWIDAGAASGRTRDALGSLENPSTGHWVTLAERADTELRARHDSALLPLSDALGGLSSPREWRALPALIEAARRHDLLSAERASQLRRGGVASAFQFINEYRTRVVAHGAQRERAFYAELVSCWQDAVGELLEDPALWGEGKLYARVAEGPEGWLLLAGRASIPEAPQRREHVEQKVPVGGVCLVAPGCALRLDPLVIFRRDATLDVEQVAFFNGLRRASRGADAAAPFGDRLRFIDYASGRVFEETDGAPRMSEILGTSGPTAPGVALEPLSTSPYRASPSGLPTLGDVFGAMKIEAELGRGHREVVFRARQPELHRTVALKVLRPEAAEVELERERFRRSLVALARCEHPNVVKVLTADLSVEPWHFTMEFVEGADLRKVARVLETWRSQGVALGADHLDEAVRAAETALSPPRPNASSAAGFHRRLAVLFAGAAEGIAVLHAQNVLHRDLKPANLVLTHDAQRLVIIDFGAVRIVDASKALSRTGAAFLGTLRYMAPEALADDRHAVDQRADIYAFGATLYELATGRPLVPGDNERQIRAALAVREPVPPAKVDPRMPDDLARIIERSIARDPAMRYPDACLLAEDLDACARDVPLPHTRPQSTLTRAREALRRGSFGVLAGALIFVSAVAFGAWSLRSARVEVHYCAAPVEQYGVPMCVTPARSVPAGGGYRLELLSGQLRRMSRVDDGGRPVEEPRGLNAGVASWDYTYEDSNGRLAEASARDRRGRVLRLVAFTFRANVDGAPGLLLDRMNTVEGVPVERAGTPVTGERTRLDDDGRAIEVRYLNRYGSVVRSGPGGPCGHRLSVVAGGAVKVREEIVAEAECR